jgi:hypothetical protein
MEQAQTFSLVDKLVLIDAEIKKLEKRRDELKEQVIALGEGNHGGHVGSVSVALQNRRNLDKDLVRKAIGDDEKFEACYKTGSSIVVRVTQFDREVV